VDAPVLSWQICWSHSESSSASADLNGLGQVLLQRALDHDLLADVAQRVGDGSRWNVAPEDVAHVLSGASIASHVREIPEIRFIVRPFHK
jgi:hypothetical protein